MKRLLFILLGGLSASLAQAQSAPPLTLQWKIAPGDTIPYKIAVAPINNDDELPFVAALPDTLRSLVTAIQAKVRNRPVPADTIETIFAEEFPERYVGLGSSPVVFARLTQQNPELIGVRMYSVKSAAEIAAYLEAMAPLLEITQSVTAEKGESMDDIQKQVARDLTPEKPLLQGAVYALGGLESFYLPLNLKNLLALLFELPQKSVREKDTWPLDVHLIVEDELEANTAHRQNQVTCRALRQEKHDRVAVLDYDIAESVSGHIKDTPVTMEMSYKAVGEFSVTRGRWLKYAAIVSLDVDNGYVTAFGPVHTNLLVTFQ